MTDSEYEKLYKMCESCSTLWVESSRHRPTTVSIKIEEDDNICRLVVVDRQVISATRINENEYRLELDNGIVLSMSGNSAREKDIKLVNGAIEWEK